MKCVKRNTLVACDGRAACHEAVTNAFYSHGHHSFFQPESRKPPARARASPLPCTPSGRLITTRPPASIDRVPVAAVDPVQRLVKHRARGHGGDGKSIAAELALGKVALRPRHAAQSQRHRLLRFLRPAEHQFGRAATDVDDQPAFVRGWQQAADAAVDQPGLLLAGNDFDRVAEQLGAALHESLAVARLAQRLGRDRAHMARGKSREALAKTRQAVPAALHGFLGEVAVGIEAAALAHGFLEIFHALEVVMGELADLEPEAVGSE
ncbi:hypothetical protein NECAME_19271, partial [Necator americanus]